MPLKEGGDCRVGLGEPGFKRAPFFRKDAEGGMQAFSQFFLAFPLRSGFGYRLCSGQQAFFLLFHKGKGRTLSRYHLRKVFVRTPRLKPLRTFAELKMILCQRLFCVLYANEGQFQLFPAFTDDVLTCGQVVVS